jgi:hypothetical protein
MDKREDYTDDLKTIKKIMEESSRFLSLSGLSGIFAGFSAVIGGFIAHFGILKYHSLFINDSPGTFSAVDFSKIKIQLTADALIVLLFSLLISYYFSYRKARSKGYKIWTLITRRFLLSFIIPLFTGAFFIIILFLENQWFLIVPSMLIFYGLALISAGKFTYNEVFYLGLAELLIGFCAAIVKGPGVLFWILGFGILHIGYGLFMYRKYEG